MSDEAREVHLALAIIDFLRSQLNTRRDFTPEDRDSLGIAIECLELAYGLESYDPRRRRVRRPLLDVFDQVSNPPPVKDKLEAETLKNEGNVKMSEQLYEEALDAYARAIRLDKYNAIYYCNRAGASLELGRYCEALVDCREALSLNPDYAKAYARMGQAYVLMERPRRAVRCFRMALELEPNNERYRNNLRAAEDQTERISPQVDVFQNILASLLGAGSEGRLGSGTFPTGITIITEITPPTSHDEEEHSNEYMTQCPTRSLESPFVDQNGRSYITEEEGYERYSDALEESTADESDHTEGPLAHARDDDSEQPMNEDSASNPPSDERCSDESQPDDGSQRKESRENVSTLN